MDRSSICRRVPFVQEPLWNLAAVSSHKDILEASHCASLTAGLRQLAGVVQHAAVTFETLHGQSLKLTERCQIAESRCQALQQAFVLKQGSSQFAKLPGMHVEQTAAAEQQDKFGNSAPGAQARSADSPGAIKAYRQDSHLAAAAATAQTAVPMQQALSEQLQVPAAMATVPLADVPLDVQQVIASDATSVGLSEPVLTQEASQPILASGTSDAAGVEGPEHSSYLSAHAVDQSQQRGSRSRSVLRQSTKDRISLIRQQQGLPTGNPAPEQLVIQPVSMMMIAQPPALVAQPINTAVAQPAAVVPVLMQATAQHPSAASDAACDVSAISIESSEAAPLSMAELHAGQGMLPQTALLELVSNPLYAKSIEVSRTTSTSPTRLEAGTSVTHIQPEALVTGISLEDSAVQVSDQPILAAASSSAVAVTETDATELPADQDVAVGPSGQLLQTSDQPILSSASHASPGSPGKAAIAEQPVALESEVLQTSDQPILGPATAAADVATAVAAVSTSQQVFGPAITASTTAVSDGQQAPALQQTIGPSQEAAADLSGAAAVIANSGDVVAVSSEPILTTAEGTAAQATVATEPLTAVPSQVSSASGTVAAMSHNPQSLQQQSTQPTEVLTEELPVETLQQSEVEVQPQGIATGPPMPALPSLRRSRSHLRSSLSSVQSSNSVRRSTSALPTIEEPQAAVVARPSPVSQLRRSVTSLQASPVPVYDESLRVSPIPEVAPAFPQPEAVVVAAAPAVVTPIPSGPLQQGAPVLPVAPGRRMESAASANAVPAIPVAPQSGVQMSGVISPQQVQLEVGTAVAAQQLRPMHSSLLHQQQAHPSLLQQSRSFDVAPQQQTSTLQAENSGPILVEAASIQSSEVQGETVQASELQQQLAPTFMLSTDALPLLAPMPPPVIPAPPPRYSPTKFLQANSWAPSPGVLQPAQPGQAAPVHSVAGPLAMSVQQSWSAPARPLPPASPLVRPPVARPLDLSHPYRASAPMSSTTGTAGRGGAELFAPGGPAAGPTGFDYSHRSSAPMASAVAGRSAEFLVPGAGVASGAMYSMPLAQSVSLGNRALQQQMSMPNFQSASAAEASRALYQQPGPLSGGLMQQAGPASPQLYQQASMPGRRAPGRAASGSVIQPMPGPVVVGQQQAAPMASAEPHAMHSRGFSIVPLASAGMQQSRDVSVNPYASPAVSPVRMQINGGSGGQTPPGGGHAKRALEAFGRASRGSLNADASVNNSYQSDRGAQQMYASEPQRAESPPTPAVPPVSYFLNSAPVVTSYITPLPQPIPMPAPPAAAPVPVPVQAQQMYTVPVAAGQGQEASRRSTRGPAFPAHLRGAVASMQNQAGSTNPIAGAQYPNAPAPVLPRVAVVAPPAYHGRNPSSATSMYTMTPLVQQNSHVTQQASGSQDGSGQFQFLAGQPSQGSSHSTPSLSNRSVPRFMEEAWARGEPGQQVVRQGAPPPPPPPPPLPGGYQMQPLAGQRQSVATNALANWTGSGDLSSQAAAMARQMQGAPGNDTALREEPSLYQSPLSHQSVSSFGSPSQATPTQVTPQAPADAAAADRNNLLASIRASRAHLKAMAPPGNRDMEANSAAGSSAGPSATLAALPPTGGSSRRRNSNSTIGIGDQLTRRLQANRASMYPESTYSESDWGE